MEGDASAGVTNDLDQRSSAMSETPMGSTGAGQDDDLRDDGYEPAGGDDSAGAGPESDLTKGDDFSSGTDGVGGGNDSRSSVVEDTLGAGGDPDDVDSAPA
jgi:hypothetical protein